VDFENGRPHVALVAVVFANQHNPCAMGTTAWLTMRLPGLLATAVSTLVFLHAILARAQCTKDTDCKGERICTAGACVDPPSEPKPDGSSPPATTLPAVTATPTDPLVGNLPLSQVSQPAAEPTVAPTGPGAGSPGDTQSAQPNKRDGVSLRVSAGLGHWYTDFQHEPPMGSGASEASSFSGSTITMGAAVEGTTSRNVMVFGELVVSLASDVTVKTPWGGTSDWSGTYGLVSAGPGVSYSFDQSGVYASGTLTITRLFGKMTDGKQGYGANLALGRDWWASTNWRTGVVAALQFAIAEDEFRGFATTFVPSVRFSLAWN